MSKISIRFFDDKEVRTVWDDEKAKWWFSVLGIIGFCVTRMTTQKTEIIESI